MIGILRHLSSNIIAISSTYRGYTIHIQSVHHQSQFIFKTRRATSAYLPISSVIAASEPAELHILPCCEKRGNIQDESEQGLHQVVMKADSEYIVKGVTEWMPKWEKN